MDEKKGRMKIGILLERNAENILKKFIMSNVKVLWKKQRKFYLQEKKKKKTLKLLGIMMKGNDHRKSNTQRIYWIQ